MGISVKFELAKQKNFFIFSPELVQRRRLAGILGNVVVVAETFRLGFAAHALEAILSEPMFLVFQIHLSQSIHFTADVGRGDVDARLAHVELGQLGEILVSRVKLRLDLLLDCPTSHWGRLNNGGDLRVVGAHVLVHIVVVLADLSG